MSEDGMEQILAPWRKLRALARPLTSIALLPVLYFLGFVAWAAHAARSSLGYLPLDPGRYLAAGVALLVPIAIATVFWGALSVAGNILFAKVKRSYLRLIARVAVDALFMAVASSLAQWATFGFFTMVPALDFQVGSMWRDIFVVFPLFFAIFYFALAIIIQIWLMTMENDSAKDSPERLLATLKPRSGPHIVAGTAYLALTIALFWGIIMMFGMNPAFGGAHVRFVTLELDSDDFGADALATLLPANTTFEPGSIVHTRVLTVLFDDAARLIIELDDGGRMEIPRDLVRAVYWKDDSSYYQ